jgi:DNA-binding CsgD family transcriptional regulator
LAQSLAPLLSGFLQLWNERAALNHRADGLASALNKSDIGIVLLDKKRHVLFNNDVADRLLNVGQGLRRTGCSISATDLGDALRLQVAIDFIMTDKNAQPCENAPVVSIKRGDALRPLMVSVLPPDRSPVHDEDTAVILYIFDPNDDVTHLLHPVCKVYRLSPVETKLACLLTNGASLCEAAKEMRVKEQTARTYLKQIFLKTDTNRQAELVRLMLCSIVRTVHGAKLQVI